MSDEKIQREIQCIYSGFAMSARDFNDFVFRDLKLPLSKKKTTKLNIFVYDGWQRGLPKDSKARAPVLRVFFGRKDNKIVIVHILFVTIVVRYQSPDQLDQNGPYRDLWYPNETDLAHLEEFRKFVEPLGGRIDVDKLEFTAKKDKGWILV
ncbi:hypothetical protein BT96DRAFT_973532 [Gymnopus androsaceus JB14]|uniref:Uncharacterized protein n=1 Tax=Gymnopus androsaceus JB14 TaxID=1447944 RepID=A0A6A4HX65_9AGAR|nr:hypothetical protein BT96DRAFT_973532 [Gymnopus androsaceus JB14]